jgi:superfamily II DNA helicase RecQ
MTHAIQNIFKKPAFRPLQAEIIATCWRTTRDVVVHMPTGGGKSILFQMLAVLQKGVILVLSPLRSLLEEQYQLASELGIPVVLLENLEKDSSGGGYKTLEDLAAGTSSCKLILSTPEIMEKNSTAQTLFKRLAEMKIVTRVVVDESHVISQSTEQYRPIYRSLTDLKFFDEPRVPKLTLSAVGSPKVISDIAASLSLQR